MSTTIYQKTDKGQDEIRTRAHHLDQRHRAVLLMINGEKTCDDILVQLQPLGMTQAVFEELEQDGYIRMHEPGTAAVKSAPATVSAAPVAVQATPTPGEPGVEGYQRLYRFYTETIS